MAGLKIGRVDWMFATGSLSGMDARWRGCGLIWVCWVKDVVSSAAAALFLHCCCVGVFVSAGVKANLSCSRIALHRCCKSWAAMAKIASEPFFFCLASGQQLYTIKMQTNLCIYCFLVNIAQRKDKAWSRDSNLSFISVEMFINYHLINIFTFNNNNFNKKNSL